MKIDPGIHIVMHLVYFGKTSVTAKVGEDGQAHDLLLVVLSSGGASHGGGHE
jgi:hypothetical protein